MNNPFNLNHLNEAIGAYYQPDLETIQTHLDNQQNIFLFIDNQEVVATLLKQLRRNNTATRQALYLDLKTINSPKQLLNALTKELIKSFSANLKDIFEFSGKYLPNLKPQFQKRGQLKPELLINYAIHEETLYAFIREFLDALERIAQDYQKPVLVMINYFDNLYFINKRKLEAIFREKISKHQKVHYILACENANAIAKIFDKKNAPHYKIKKMLAFKPVSDEFKLNYIQDTFKMLNHESDMQINQMILNKTSSLHNIYRLCHKLFELAAVKHHLSPQLLKDAIADVLAETAPCYQNMWDSLSAHQQMLLYSIASQGGSQIFSGRYLLENELGSAPSVQTSVGALLKKNILLKKDKDFFFTDYFFKEWIQAVSA